MTPVTEQCRTAGYDKDRLRCKQRGISGRCHSPLCKRRGIRPGKIKSGFTLLELVLVVFLLTLILGMSAVFSFSRVTAVKFEGLGREMAASLKEARLLAYINNQKTMLTIDLDARRWGIQGRRSREMPPEVQIRIIDPVQGELIKGVHNLAFFPTGRVDGKNIVLQEGKKEWQLITDPIAGAVIIKGQ